MARTLLSSEAVDAGTSDESSKGAGRFFAFFAFFFEASEKATLCIPGVSAGSREVASCARSNSVDVPTRLPFSSSSTG